MPWLPGAGRLLSRHSWAPTARSAPRLGQHLCPRNATLAVPIEFSRTAMTNKVSSRGTAGLSSPVPLHLGFSFVLSLLLHP